MPEQTKTSPHWLATVCDPNHHKEIVQHPWLVQWHGDPWTVATDGRQLVLLRGHHADAPEAPPDVLARFQPMLDAAAGTPLDWPRFAAWIGPATAGETCRNCGGDGRCNGCHCDAEHDCGDCDGTGKVDPGPVPMRFRGHLADRHRLARLLPHLDATGPVTAAWVLAPNATDGSHMLVIDGPGWRLCLMEMTPPDAKDVPEFEASEAMR